MARKVEEDVNKERTSGGATRGGAAAISRLDMTLSNANVRRLQNVAFYNVIKYFRFKYYTKEHERRESKGSEDKRTDVVFKVYADFLLTTIVCIFLQATRQDSLAMGTLVDQLASMAVYWKFETPTMMLLPYYVPFI